MLWQEEASGPLLSSNHSHKFDLCLSVHTSHCSVIPYSPSQEVWFFLCVSFVLYCCSWRLCEAKALFAYIMQLFPHWVLLLVQAFLESKAQALQLSNLTNLYENLIIFPKVMVWDRESSSLVLSTYILLCNSFLSST